MNLWSALKDSLFNGMLSAVYPLCIGYATLMDVCSLCHNGQLLMFSAAAMNFGIKHDPTTPLGREYQWIGRKSLFDSSAIKAFWKTKYDILSKYLVSANDLYGIITGHLRERYLM